MARRIQSKKTKHFGNRTFGKGNKKNRRGKGSKGGTGHGGYHKQNWMRTIKYEGTIQTAPGFVNPTRRHTIEMPLSRLAGQIGLGKFQQQEGAYSIDVTQKGKRVKVLGNGEFGFKANVKANAFTANAKEKIEKAGGSVLLAQ